MNAMVKAASREVSAALRDIEAAAELGALTDDELLRLLRQSPMMGKILTQGRAVRQELRSKLVAERDAELEQSEKALPAAKRSAEQTAAALTEAREQLQAAERAHREAADGVSRLGLITRWRVDLINHQLEQLAPPAIQRFIGRMDSSFEEARTRNVIAIADRFDTPDKAEARRSEYVERSLRMEGLLAASKKAEELKRTDLDGPQLDEALADLEANLIELAKAARRERGERVE